MSELWVDESRWQGTVDHVKMKASGITGTVCNDGDPGYQARVQSASSAGLKVGTYHYLGAGEDAYVAADAMLARIRASGVAMTIHALDIEEGTGDQSNRALSFLDTVQQSGNTPLIYTGNWFITGRLTDPRLGTYGLWLADYSYSEPPPPEPWSFIEMWQFTDKANVPGVAGGVDESRLYVINAGGSPVARPPVEKGTMNNQEVSAAVALAYKLRAAKIAADGNTRIDTGTWHTDGSDPTDFANQVNAVMNGSYDLHEVVNNITNV